ncbi:MAG: helix-turn-helix transcriptional regulator [Raoultibacter sp.]
MDAINIGAVIARCRKKWGITQDEVAQHLGVSKAAVSKWEMGQSLPDVGVFSSAVWQECTDKTRFRKITSPLGAL